MRLLPQRVFDIYLLSRSRGMAFGGRPPIAAYCSDDGVAYGALTRCEKTGFFGVECMRRRTDQVWALSITDIRLFSYLEAMKLLEQELRSGIALLAVPSGEPVRPSLAKLGPKGAGSAFQLLNTRSHYPAAWVLNQVYLAFPRPDRHWARDCQTGNFHTRIWEAYLLACFREQGCLVKQNFPSPDFWIERRGGSHAWIEAVTANEVPYDHVVRGAGNFPKGPPDEVERQTGSAAVRFAKTLRGKLQKKYTELAHVKNEPFAIAIADFHEHGSMMWSREALIAYLYGVYGQVEEREGERVGVLRHIDELLGADKIPAGLFSQHENASLSAVIFSNAATIAKFNRMGYLAGVRPPGIRIMRAGSIFDRRLGALQPIPFSMDIGTEDYASLWPGLGETWSLELEVFHNPSATIPFPFELLPECSHWFVDENGDITTRAYHKNNIISSVTTIWSDNDKDFTEGQK
jgi:hypothetical protein